MYVARSFEAIHFAEPTLLTIGTFDGVHRGHRYLLEQARRRADEEGYGLVVVTFDPCPAVVLRPTLGRYQISTAEQKLAMLGTVGPAVIAMLDFTPELSHLTASEFMDALEARLDLREMWFGEDFRFGRDRGGDLGMLVERGRDSGFSLHVVSRRMEDKQSISSSRIRHALLDGDVAGAIPLLGYPFCRACSPGIACTWTDQRVAATRHTVAPHLALPADGMYATFIQDRDDPSPAIVEVRRDAPADQIIARDSGIPGQALTVEFVKRLCSADAYRGSSAAWDKEAKQFLDGWQRPEYGPTGHY
jgi:riboflavin kinase/FMN adenylyltransferase